MKPIIVYRNDLDWKNEESAAKKYFQTTSHRNAVQKDQLVIPRFSFLPFAKEFCDDIEYVGGTMINNYSQHRYIADLGNWYYDLQEFTPKTYRTLPELPENTPFVLKGETNSKKFSWQTHMFASNKQDAIRVHSNLVEDGLIGYQQIYIREYVELEKLMDGINGMPITKEYRFFFYKDKLLSAGFYWSNYYQDLIEMGIKLDPNEVPQSFLDKVVKKIQSTTVACPPNFYVIDVAKTASNDFIVIELNDGCMSGLSMNDPEILYSNLAKQLQ